VLPLDNADTAWLAEKEDRNQAGEFHGLGKVGWELRRTRAASACCWNWAATPRSSYIATGRTWTTPRCATAHSAFNYAGQSCVSTQRVFVERSIFQTFLWKVVDVAGKLALGRPVA